MKMLALTPPTHFNLTITLNIFANSYWAVLSQHLYKGGHGLQMAFNPDYNGSTQ